MIIEDIYSGENEKLYSVLLDPEEMRIFSKLQDEDYIEENESAQKAAKYGRTIGGAALGTILGGGLGSKFHGKRALAGAAIGGSIGHYFGKRASKRYKKDLERYLKASEADKKYLREKESHRQQLAALEIAGARAGLYGGILSRG